MKPGSNHIRDHCSFLIYLQVLLVAVFIAQASAFSESVTFQTPSVPHLAFPQQGIEVSLLPELKGTDFNLVYEFIDYTGLIIGSDEVGLTVGRSSKVSAPEMLGAFKLEYQLKSGELIYEIGTYTLAVIAERGPPDSPIEDSPFGSCVAAKFENITPGINARSPADFTLANLAGFRWSRPMVLWQAIEPRPGKFNWKEMDAMIDQRAQAGIAMAPVIGQTPPWAAVDRNPKFPPKDFEALQNFMRELVSRYKDRVKYWILWNEQNSKELAPGWTVESYVATMKAACQGAKEADPECQILICGVAFMDLDWIEEVYRAGGKDYFDIMNLHPYCFPASPESKTGGDILSISSGKVAVFDRTNELRSLMANHGDGDKPIWITELSWSNGLDHINGTKEQLRPHMNTSREQAQFIVRAHVLAMARGLEKVFLLCLPDLPAYVQSGPFDEFSGLVTLNNEPKLSYVAYANMTAQLEGARFEKELKMERPSQHGYVFDRNGKKVTVLWDTDATSLVSLHTGEPNAQVIDMVGNSEVKPPYFLVISGDPTYVVGGESVQYVKPVLPERE